MATQKLIMAFVTLIIGIALIGVISSVSLEVTSKDVILNETFDITAFKTSDNYSAINTTITQDLTNAYTDTNWQYDSCAIDVTLLAMDNGTAATSGTDYNVTVNGAVALQNIDFWWTESASNSTLVNYIVCQDDYITLGWGRSMLSIVPGFFAVALLMTSLALFYSIAKDTGII